MSDNFKVSRSRMVATQIAARGITNKALLTAMAVVPRHRFLPQSQKHLAYRDHALPIGERQSTPTPYIVSFMTQLLGLRGDERVLEIGTGSGYQTALLCHLASYVYSLEIRARLAGRAARVLDELGYENLDIHVGDGSQGLPDMAPFDAILVTAAAPALPTALIGQLNADGGRLVVPVGSRTGQYLQVVTRHQDSWRSEETEQVRLLPLVGRDGFHTPSYSPWND